MEVVTEFGDLERLAPEWEELWEGGRVRHPFMAPGWLLPWWRNLGGGALRVFAVRAQEQLVGLLPMFLHQDGAGARLLPLGIGVSDAFDLVAAPGATADVVAALRPVLATRGGDWTACELHEVPAGSALQELSASSSLQSVSPLLDLAHFAALPCRSGARRRLSRARRAASQAGVSADRPGAEAIEELFVLHAAQWRARGGTGVLDTPALQAFHREAAASLERAGVLRLHRLRQGSRTVAMLYGFSDGERACGYLSGIDPTCADLGLGTVLIGAAIDAARAEGARTFDFLRGNEPYKYVWGAVDHPTLRLDLSLPRPRRPVLHVVGGDAQQVLPYAERRPE